MFGPVESVVDEEAQVAYCIRGLDHVVGADRWVGEDEV
jgi:hypothetical protein